LIWLNYDRKTVKKMGIFDKNLNPKSLKHT